MNIWSVIGPIMTIFYLGIGIVWFWSHVVILIVKFVKFLIRKIKEKNNQFWNDKQ